MSRTLLIVSRFFLHHKRNQKEIVIRCLFYLVILFIFSRLWQATAFAEPAQSRGLLWYLAVTELIVMAPPPIQVEIEADIRSGDIVYQLIRPIDYLWLKVAEASGACLFRFLALMVAGLPWCALLAGQAPPPGPLLASLTTALLAALVFVLFQALIGLSAFLLQDPAPCYWLWQRASFIFGGMLLPLDFYPELLRKLTLMLPFASLLYAPAKLVMAFSWTGFLVTLAAILIWGLVAAWLAHAFYLKLLAALKINGG